MITSDHPRLQLAQGARASASATQRNTREAGPAGSRLTRLVTTRRAVLVLAVAAVGLLANPALRQWVLSALGNIAVVGGIVAAPLLSVAAWVGMVLPVRAPLHQASSALFIAAMVWLAAAFVCAHAHKHHLPHDH